MKIFLILLLSSEIWIIRIGSFSPTAEEEFDVQKRSNVMEGSPLTIDSTTVEQSSTHLGRVAVKAVDNNLNQKPVSCSLTTSQTDPWWRVAISKKSFISGVQIWAPNKYSFRLNNFELLLSENVDHPVYVKCSYDSSSISNGDIISVSCGRRLAKMVKIQLKGSRRVLNLCEVKIFGFAVGTWSNWSNWTLCTQTCNGGKMTRSRTCNSSTDHYCPGDAKEVEKCNINTSCRIIGIWSQWSNYTSCSQTCGGRGKRTRFRTCNSTQNSDCPGQAKEFKNCFLKSCSTKLDDNMDLLSVSFSLSLVVIIEIVSLILMCFH